jgi:hypothetical protein
MKVTSKTYSFVESATSGEEWHVKINEGDYKGIVYKYGKIQINELSDEANLKFQFKIVDLPEHLDEDELNSDVDFMTQLGDILTHIIEDSLDTGHFKLGQNDKSTDSESTMH